MRKGFNFYRSYYDVSKELNEKDRLLFLWAILEKQFEGKEPILKGQSNFAYISQKHSIDAQVVGYETKTKLKLTPTEPPCLPPTEPPLGQEKGKGKEKGKGELTQSKVSFKDSLLFDKNEFKKAFHDWTKEKLLYYYEQVLTWSGEGNKKLDWKATVRTWASRDEKQGKIKFNVNKQGAEDGLL